MANTTTTSKENDYLLNRMSNDNFTNLDFVNVGLNGDNTSLESKETYEKLAYVQNNEMFQTDGKFNQQKFDDFYKETLAGYNQLTNLDTAKVVASQLSYFKGDIFAPLEQRDFSPQFIIEKTYRNPDRQKISNWGFNSKSDPTKSAREIGQTQLTYDYVTEEWVDSPNDDGFFGNFFDTKVLATYDSDGTHIDPITGEEIKHKKGQKKLNENGTYYYETLGDRDIYGKEVLSKFDVLTTDGSVWNEYDFFDSDDLEKSITGSLVRNIVKVAPAFIPYVAPWYIGARVGLETVNLFTKVGKMIAGSESPTLSSIEGFIKSTNLSTSDYGQQHMWAMENILNMGADVFTQLAEQRWLFEYAPSLMKGSKLGFSKEAQKKFTTDFQASKIKQLKETKNSLSALAKKSGGQLDEILWSDGAMKASALAEANLTLENTLKSNYKIGEYLSKAYMTGVTVADSYGEAKNAGASDLEAALFTLGYAAGEMAILNTQLGEWILPELRIEKQKMRKIIKELTGKQPPQTASTAEKIGWMKKIIQTGKEWFKGEMADDGVTKNLFTHAISNALGEGFEETAEAALADISKVLANGVYWATGSKTYLKPTWEDEEGNINIMNTLNEYALNFVGGVIGGGIGNLLPAYREAKRIKNLNENNSAYQELLYYVREGKADEIKAVANKMVLGNKELSIFRTEDGYQPAKPGDNQDLSAKVQFSNYIDKLEQIINLEKDVVKSDEEIRMDLILKDLRFQHLLDSKVASSYLQNYHTTVAELTTVDQELETLQNPKQSDNNNKEAVKKNEEKIAEKQKQRDELRDKLTKFIDGTEGKNYIKDALFEMEHGLSKGYTQTNFLEYIQAREIYDGHNREVKDIPESVLNQYKEEWESKKYDHKDEIRFKRILFDVYNDKLSNRLKGHINDYMEDFQDKFFIKEFEEAANSKKALINGSIADFSDLTLSSHLLNNFLSVNNSTTDTSVIEEFVDNTSAQNLVMHALLNDLEALDSNNKELNDTFEVVRHLENLGLLYDSETESLRIDQQQYQKLQGIDPELFSAGNLPTIIPTDPVGARAIASSLVANHKNIFDKFVSKVLNEKADQITTSINKTKYIKASTRQYLKDFIKEHTDDHVYELYRSSIDSVKYTPINELLDAEQAVLGDKSIKYSDLITALQEEAYKSASSGTLAEFGYDDVTWEDSIKHFEELINILSSHLSAGRTDDINPMNPFGYNYTVNELIPDAGLVTYDVDTYNVLAQDLSKLSNELKFYKRIVQINENNLFSTQPKVAVERLFRITEGLKLMFPIDVDVPDWEGYKELGSIIAETHNILGNLYRSEGILSANQQVEYRKARLKLNEAIHEFFKKNDSKTDEQFSELFTKNNELKSYMSKILTASDKGDSYESVDGSDLINVKTLFSYLAANASTSYGSFLKKYKDVIKSEKDYIHTEGGENLLFHEVSFATSKKYWNRFTNTYNEIQQELLASGSIGNDPYFLNNSDSKKNSHSTLLFKSTFLSEGIAGVGKSTANLTLFLKLTAGLGDLHNKIFLVHKTLEDAIRLRDELVKSTGISEDNFMCFSHETYMDHINPNREKPANINNILKFTDEQVKNGLIQREDNTWHYKNEDEINLDKTTPSFVIVDEATNLSTIDTSQHEAYIEKVGIKALFLGDFNQSTIEGSFTDSESGITEHLFNHRHNFFQTFGLVFSFRSDNKYNIDSQKAVIQVNEQIKNHIKTNIVDLETIFDQINNDDSCHYDLKYNESNAGLFGIKTDSYDQSKEFEVDGDIAKSINIMLNSLGKDETITYIYYDENSPLYKYIQNLNAGDKIKAVYGSAQGREGQYYILEEPPLDFQNDPNNPESLDYDVKLLTKHIKDLYTSLSRAKQGTLLITNPRGLNENTSVIPRAKSMQTVGKFKLSQQFKEATNVNIADQIDAVLESEYGDLTLDYSIKSSKITPPNPITKLSDTEVEEKATKTVEGKIDEVPVEELDDLIDELEKRITSGKITSTKTKDALDQLKKEREKREDVKEETLLGSDGSLDDGTERKVYKQPDDGSYCIGQMYSFNAYDPGIDKDGNLVLDYGKINKNPNQGILPILKRAKNKKLTVDDLKQLSKMNISITSIQGLALLGFIETEEIKSGSQITGIKVKNLEGARKLLHNLMYYFKYGEMVDDVTAQEINDLFNDFKEQFEDPNSVNISSRIGVKINKHTNVSGRNSSGRLENVRGIDPNKAGPKIEPRNKKLCGVIGIQDDSGQSFIPLLEIPLFTYPNPLSLLESFGIKEDFDKYLAKVGKKRSANQLGDFLRDPKYDDKKYDYLKKLNQIFTSDITAINYITDKDGNFVTNIRDIQKDQDNIGAPERIQNTGIDIVSTNKGEDYEYTNEYTWIKETQKLKDLVSNAESNIYIHKKAITFKQDITINGKTVVYAGKPYVIISEDQKVEIFATDAILQKYLQDIKTYGSSKYKLISVNSPTLSLDKYFQVLTENDSVNKGYLEQRRELGKLGNKTTILKILTKLLEKDSTFLKFLRSGKFKNVYEPRLNALIKLVEEINKIIEENETGTRLLTITTLLCTPIQSTEFPKSIKDRLLNACKYEIQVEGSKIGHKQLINVKTGPNTSISRALITEFTNLLYYGYQFQTGVSKSGISELKRDNNPKTKEFYKELHDAMKAQLASGAGVQLLYNIPISETDTNGHVDIAGDSYDYLYLDVDMNNFIIKGIPDSELEVSGKLDTCSLFGNISVFIDAGAKTANRTGFNKDNQDDVYKFTQDYFYSRQSGNPSPDPKDKDKILKEAQELLEQIPDSSNYKLIKASSGELILLNEGSQQKKYKDELVYQDCYIKRNNKFVKAYYVIKCGNLRNIIYFKDTLEELQNSDPISKFLEFVNNNDIGTAVLTDPKLTDSKSITINNNNAQDYTILSGLVDDPKLDQLIETWLESLPLKEQIDYLIQQAVNAGATGNDLIRLGGDLLKNSGAIKNPAFIMRNNKPVFIKVEESTLSYNGKTINNFNSLDPEVQALFDTTTGEIILYDGSKFKMNSEFFSNNDKFEFNEDNLQKVFEETCNTDLKIQNKFFLKYLDEIKDRNEDLKTVYSALTNEISYSDNNTFKSLLDLCIDIIENIQNLDDKEIKEPLVEILETLKKNIDEIVNKFCN